MIKDYIIIDNILDNPQEIIDLSRNISYYSKQREILQGISIKPMRQGPGFSDSKWKGYRSDFLHEINQKIFSKITDQIFSKIFSDYDGAGFKYEYQTAVFLHFAPGLIQVDDTWWHSDPDCFYAGVIYLTENPEPNSGTILKLNNEEVVLENVFNRLIMYRSNIVHRPQKCFGNTIENSRLTITIFLNRMMIDGVRK